jgi:hypothetical protein
MSNAPHPSAILKRFGKLEAWEWYEGPIRKLELTGEGVLPAYQTEALSGDFVDEDHYEIILREDADVYKPRAEDLLSMFGGEETDEDRLLVSFRKGVIDPELVQRTAELLRSAAGKTDNRGMASGPVDERKLRTAAQGGKLVFDGNQTTRAYYILPDGTRSSVSAANKVNSGLMGNFDADARHQFCRQTSWTKGNQKKTLEAIPFLERVSECFRAQAPIRWQRQKDFLVQNGIEAGGWVLGNSVFTTVTVNRNFRTAVHQDAGDFPGGYGNLIVYEGKPYRGGYTGFPQYRVAVDARTGDFLAMDVHEWHGNTALSPVEEPPEGEEWDDLDNTGFERMTFVCYTRYGMKDCGSVEEEMRKWEAWHQGFKPPKVKAQIKAEAYQEALVEAEQELLELQELVGDE